MYSHDVFWINDCNFKVEKKKIVLKPENEELKINSEFEISGSFRLPPKSIYVKYSFPNQISNLNYLTLDSTKSCATNYGDTYCRVYSNKSFLSLANDRFFKRKIVEPTSVSLKVNFEVDSTNFKLLPTNYGKSQHNTKTQVCFIERVSNTSLQNVFDYQNTYSVTRKKGESEHKHIELVREINIESNQPTTYQTTKVELLLFNNDDLSDRYLKNWFSFEKHGFQLNQIANVLEFGNQNEHYQLPLNKQLTKTKDSFSYQHAIVFDNHRKESAETGKSKGAAFLFPTELIEH